VRKSLAATAVAGILILLGVSGCGSNDSEPEPASAPPEFFGVAPQGLLTGDDLDRMDQGNVGTVRIVVPWASLDPGPEPGDGDFTTIDPVVLLAAQHGIQVLPTIYGTPEWVAEDLDGRDCAPNCSAFAPRSPRGLAAFGDFVGELVDRYGPNGALWAEHPESKKLPIHAWQIWNEQNSPTFYQPDVDPAGYADLLRAASTSIKDRDPGAEIVLGGMFGTPPPGEPAWDFLRDLYRLDDTREYFDTVAAHPYAAQESGIEDQVAKLHRQIERAGDTGTRLWITEVGSSSDEGANPLERGPEGQAEQLRAAFDFFLQHRETFDIQGVIWYSWRDSTDPNQCDWCPGSGLFEADSLTPKDSWREFVSFTGGS
jgi:hypothetical protein